MECVIIKEKDYFMYLENPKKLFEDLYDLPTMYDYMVACKEDGMHNNISNLISIAFCNRNQVHDGGEGSERWNLEYCETEQEKQQIIKDSKVLNAICVQIKKELKAKYVIQCESCHYAWFAQTNTKCVKSVREHGRQSGFKCFCKSSLMLYNMDEWCEAEHIDIHRLRKI